MIQYLPENATSLNELVDVRSETDKGIVFYQSLSEIKELCYEVSQNMASLVLDGNNAPLIDEFAMTEDRPSQEMLDKFFQRSWSEITNLLTKVYNDDLKEVNLLEGEESYIAVINNPKCNENILRVVDDVIRDCFVYSVVCYWFTETNHSGLKEMALSEYNASLAKLLSSIRKLEAALLRKPLKSAIFDSMI